eukprot:s123_g1.t1
MVAVPSSPPRSVASVGPVSAVGAHVFVTPTREPPMPTAVQRGDPLRSPREILAMPSFTASPSPGSVSDGQLIRASTDEPHNEVLPSDFPPLFPMPKLSVPAIPWALPVLPFPSHQHPVTLAPAPPMLPYVRSGGFQPGPSTFPPLSPPFPALPATACFRGVAMPTVLAVPGSERGDGKASTGAAASEPGKSEASDV